MTESSGDHLQPTAKEIGYFRVTDRSYEDVDKVLSLGSAVKKLKPRSRVLDIGSGLSQKTAEGIRQLRDDIFVMSSDATLGLSRKDFEISYPKNGTREPVTYSKNKHPLPDTEEIVPESYQKHRREKAIDSVVSLQPSLPFADKSFDLIIDSWGPGMYLDRRPDSEGKTQLTVYLDNICRTLKRGGELRMYPIDDYNDTLLSDEERNKKALLFFNKYFKDKVDNFIVEFFGIMSNFGCYSH